MKGQAEPKNEGEGTKGVSLEELKKKMADFAKERDRDQFHSPRNLLLALVGEVGELFEIFQWKGEVPRGLPDWEEKEKQHLGEELSDVLLYLVRLSDICGIDLGKAALRKLEINAINYPVSLCKGSSKKLTLWSKSTTTRSSTNINIGNDSANGVTDDELERQKREEAERMEMQKREEAERMEMQKREEAERMEMRKRVEAVRMEMRKRADGDSEESRS
ncbi:uncharacterized protein LOC132622278 [Lycium barbarum]|uniref:uncharacterized protein LOC132622278 n=1 Tax=Lycium barbarum TaxID=112863 RepID=UPI00293E9D7E|nr:uncharacterized protein LOC132622278 [Lycium barbarum]XP_060192843.1 uncharacterized protein LOC132622278 [Lycium barbarum]XP_060192844.1 uncharacterized protein LOC132622278 [Lycium barbarum]XP_060192845.1 uncharacterized protein LOC132622278 [Lycium barbarum]